MNKTNVKTFLIVDIDGTICDSTKRMMEVCDKWGPVDDWSDGAAADFLIKEKILKDKVIKGSKIIFNLAKIYNTEIIFLTGRSAFARDATRLWLTKVFKASSDIPLYMREKQYSKMTTPDCKEAIFLNEVFSKYPNARYIFFEDEPGTAQRYISYGHVFRSPDCWKLLNKWKNFINT